MLRHPFFGVIDPDANADGGRTVDRSADNDQPAIQGDRDVAAPSRRRTFFGQALAGAAGLGALVLFGRSASAQSGGTGSFNPGGAAGGSFDRGFAGQSQGSFRGGLGGDSFGDPGPRYQSGGTVTTYAIGEEGSGGGGTVTTYAIGEEGSGGGTVTTYAIGEEGSGGGVTTYALGEEGSYRPPQYYRYRNYRPRYTTYALGEEGGRRW
jgi:hypothetical protein